MQRRRSYQWLSELVESDTERVVGFQRMFGVQWVTPPNANNANNNNNNGGGAANNAAAVAVAGTSGGGNNNSPNGNSNLSNSNSSLGSSSDSINVECVQYVRGHFLIYCLFRFGAFLGEELFYTLFLPNFGWSVNYRLGRQLILMWAVMYYSGQLLKDVMQLPRPPCPPVVHLEKHFADEYGFPSTHAMAAISVPFFIAIKLTPPMAVLLDSVQQVMGPESGLLSILESPLQTPPLILSLILLWSVAFMWWITMTCSRLFLGVHSFVDVFAGMVLGLLAMSFCLMFADYIDRWVALSSFGGVGFVIIGILLVIFFWYAAKPTKWTPCYGDTTLIVGVGVGSLVGSRYVIGPLWDHEILPWTVLPTFFASEITSELIQRKVMHFFFRSFVGYALMATVRVVVKQCMLSLMHMLLPLWKSNDPIASMEAGMVGSGNGGSKSGNGELIEPPTPELRYDGQSSSDVGRYATEIPTKFVTYFAVSYCAAAALHPLFEYYDWYS